MNRWKAAFFALLAVTLVGAAAAAYGLVDSGVTQTYMEVGYSDAINDLEVLRELVPAVRQPLTRTKTLTLLRRQHPTALIVATDSSVQIGQLTFLFASTGTLRSITHPSTRSARP